MSARNRDVNRALDEGVAINFMSFPVRFLHSAMGTVKGLEYSPSVADAEAPDTPPCRGKQDRSPAQLKADVIINACERKPDLTYFSETHLSKPGFKMTPKGTLQADRFSQLAAAPNIFAAGDLHTGRATVISAVAGGRLAARSIHHLLTGGIIQLPENMQQKVIPNSMLKDVRITDSLTRISIAEIPVATRRQTFVEEVINTIDHAQAQTEAQRCLQCGTYCYDGMIEDS